MKYEADVQHWIDEIDDAKKREKDFRKDGADIIDLYNGKDNDKYPFNILYSNTETLQPALYSQLPRPAVKERFTQKDNKGFSQINPLNRAVCEASNNMLSYLLDTNIEGYEKFTNSIKACVLDALLPGRGVTAIQFESDDDVDWACVVGNTKKYDRVYHGFATKWEEVPWIAYEEFIDEKEAKKKFGEVANKIQFTDSEEDEKDTEDDTARIYQIWDKDTKTVKWISDSCEEFLLEQEDPLGVSGFFNTPKPLMLHRKSNDLMPTPLYTLYENQAKELNRLTRSINKIAMAIKVRGGYDGNLGEIFERILDEEDNTLVPVENVTALMDGGFEKHIWILPLGELVGVLQTLYASREQCKTVIYEITGISDIIRGQSKASETLGAQKVKEAWGTMRLKNMQSDVQEYVRDVLRIMLDVAVNNIPQKIWMKVTGLPYPTRKKKEKGVKLMNKLKMLIQDAVQQQDDKKLQKLQKEAADLAEMLSQPSWEDILETLEDDYIRSFKVDIETNSTLDAEATDDKKNLAEGMNAIAQFMNGLLPMVEKGILPFPAAKSMLLDTAKRFRFGQEVEEEINAMEPPKDNREQIEQKAKQVADEKKKLNEQQKKLEEEKKRAGDMLDERFRKLEMENMKFEFKQKLFKEQQNMERKLAVEELKNMDKTMNAELETDRTKAEMKLEKQMDKAERKIQGLLDKYSSNIEKTVTSVQQAIPESTPKKKVVKLVYDGNKPVGAEVEELDEKASGEVTFTYNESGKPDGAIVN